MMNADEIKKVLLEAVQAVKRKPLPPDFQIAPEANLRETLELDSLDMLEIVDELERRLNISLDLESLRKMTTAGEIVAMVTEKVAERKAA